MTEPRVLDTTDGPVSEERLRDQLQRRLLAVATAYDVIWEWDLSTDRVDWSDSLWTRFGHSKVPENETYAFWRSQVHPEDLARIEPGLMSASRGADGTFWEAEYRFRRGDGSWAWVSDRGRVYRPAGGARVGWMIGAIRDVSESREAMERLSASEARYRALVESGTVAVWRVDPQGRFVESSPGLCELLGIAPQQVMQHRFDWSPYVHPDDFPRAVSKWQEAMASGAMYEVAQRLRMRDGSWRWYLARAVPVRDANGRIVEWVGTHHDIHAQTMAEQVLRESAERARDDRRRLERIIDGLPVAVVLADRATGQLTFKSRMATQLTWNLVGSQDPALFDQMVEIYDRTGKRLSEAEWPLSRARRGERVVGEEITYRTPRFSMTALVDGVVFADGPDAGTETVLMCYRDVTQLKNIEAELRSASEAKDRFLAVLSHELRTPLTPVLTSVQLLEADASLPMETRETLGVIRRNVELEARLIDDLLDLTRISRGKLRMDRRALDLGALLSNVIDICRADVRAKGLRLQFGVKGGGIGAGDGSGRANEPVVVTGDAARLHQVFWNLLKNAVKFTPEGGLVSVELQREVPEGGGGAGEAVVRVSDTGIGIPASLLPRVFDAFMQGEHDARRFGGLGLGLAIARALVELHGGKLTAWSGGERQGATFEVRLPLSTSADHPVAVSPSEAGGGGPSLRILLVEDHTDTSRVLQRLLKHYGHVPTTVSTVAQALAVLRAGEKFDLMVSDIGLPDGSGYDLMRQSVGIRPPAIALSGFGMEDDIQRSREVGFVEHLTKPVDAAYLEQVILRVASGART